VAMLRRCGSIDYARSYARDLIAEARSYLTAIRESDAREVLASMADFFLERER
jgi:geranylgeranyl pyrophosphate synthase